MVRKDSNPRPGRPPKSPRFLVGTDSRGNWIVRDRARQCGRLFVDRAEALRFAMLENGTRPTAVVMIPTTLELKFSLAT